MNIDHFKREHADLMVAVTELRDLVHAGVQDHAQTILQQLVAMSAAIKLHLAAEDRVLYPALVHATDPHIAQTGKQFQEEMGDLAQVYMAFTARWNLAAKISKDPDGFRSDANNVFKALHLRVQRENKELYPLAEQV
ncbi:hemerythrin domain-containing protein [Dyella monticola]|uniref:Hemerythrin domain-containing protein n=1 Tax=Dyella monticola TaxID=1927958 RepID=A0A370WV17_9GAMM|nr:hemerythrin domain-containing protein [Dyella monticola]RDS79876.1 hemerythrin domain-containing protein [Dyella monticola]